MRRYMMSYKGIEELFIVLDHLFSDQGIPVGDRTGRLDWYWNTAMSLTDSQFQLMMVEL